MYKITGKQAFGAVWYDGKPLVAFYRGVGYVATAEAAETLKGMGYTVEGEPEAPANQHDPSTIKALEQMTAAELKAVAAKQGINLKGVPNKKADMIAAIRAAEADQGGTPPDPDPATPPDPEQE